MENDIIFQPLEFRHLTVKNRIFRSNISDVLIIMMVPALKHALIGKP